MKFNLKIVAATAAVAMMSSAAYAGSVAVTGGPYTYSKEGLTLTGNAGVNLPQIEITFGNSLTYQDDIIITIPGVVPLAPSTNVNLAICTSADPLLPDPSIGYVQTVANGWQFRITSVGGASIGDKCTIGNPAIVGPPAVAANYLRVTGVSLATASTQVDYRAYRFFTGTEVDRGTNTTGISVLSQFALLVQQPLNAEIDVYQGRLLFTPATAETIPPGGTLLVAEPANDTLNFTTSGTAFLGLPAWTGPTVVTASTVLTIKGDYRWVDANGNGTCTTAEFGARVVGYSQFAIDGASSCTQLVLRRQPPGGDVGDYVAAGGEGYYMVPGNFILSPTDYIGEATWNYRLATDATKTGTLTKNWNEFDNSPVIGFQPADPGAWTINGAQVYIQYMPYGNGISRIIYAANSGPINADVELDLFANGQVYPCSLGGVPKQAVTMLSAAIDACVAAEGITSGRVAMLLTFTAPDTDIEVYSAYNVGGNDRGTVVNTSNGRSPTYFSINER